MVVNDALSLRIGAVDLVEINPSITGRADAQTSRVLMRSGDWIPITRTDAQKIARELEIE